MTPMCLERDGLSLIEWAPLRGLANKKAHRTVPSVTVLKSWSEIPNISAGYSSENTLKPILILNWQYVGEKTASEMHRGYNNNKAVSPSSLICPQFVVSCVSCWCGNVFWAWLNRTTKVLCRLSVLQLRLLFLHHIRFFPPRIHAECKCMCVQFW